MSLSTEGMNDNQRRATEWDSGPLLVLAGPGSGKTRVLATRVVRLLQSSAGQAFRILGLTFTNKAAAEMRTRVVEHIAYDEQSRVLLTTFHSFCGDVLRQHGTHVGVRPDFAIMSTDLERRTVLEEVVCELAAADAAFHLPYDAGKLLKILDECFSILASPESIRDSVANRELGMRIACVYTAYRAELLKRNTLDFASLVSLTHELFTAKVHIVRQLRLTYKHVCVDEFQDTNAAQYEILRHLARPDPSTLFVVADDDQVLYEWNGATPERLTQLRTEFNAGVVQLPTNYRCPPEVIELANRLICCNGRRSRDKEPLIAVRDGGAANTVRSLEFRSIEEELSWIASDIASRGAREWGGCVVLARTNAILMQACGTINEVGGTLGLEAVLTLRKDEFRSTPVRWLYEFLHFAVARNESKRLDRVCALFEKVEGIRVSSEEIRRAGELPVDLLHAWVEEALTREDLEPVTRTFLERHCRPFVQNRDHCEFIPRAFEWLDAMEGFGNNSDSEGFTEYRTERATWIALSCDTCDKYGEEQVTLELLLQEFDLSSKAPPVSADAVRCMTIHGAKGMEFRHVYLVGLADEVLPSYWALKKGDASVEVEEERRNCFVAITRTQSTLTLTRAQVYSGWQKSPSRFLREMDLL